MSSPPDRLSSVALVKPNAVWFRKRNQAIEVLEAGSVVQIAQKFERFLELPTVARTVADGAVRISTTQSPVSSASPTSPVSRTPTFAFEKLRAAARAMNFSLNTRRVERGE